LRFNGISSAEIARLAGVSRSTVSRVINNYPNVPEKTRQKVMSIIEDQNYFPNISAQVLAGKKNRVLGLFMISQGHVSSDALTSFIISSVIESAAENGYYVLTNILKTTKDKHDTKTVKELFYQRRIDGGIFIGGANHEPFVEELIADGFIVGLVDHELPGRQEPNRIVMNFENVAGAEKAVDYLVSLNHRKIGILNGDFKRLAGPAKYEGFLRGMQKHGLQVRKEWVIPGDFNGESGYQAAQQLLRSSTDLPTAVFAVNDSVAFGAIRAFQEHGLRVPEDISVLGFDDHLLSSYHKPAVTTFRVDFYEMMRKLTLAVLHVIENGNDRFIKMTMDAELIERESCRRI